MQISELKETLKWIGLTGNEAKIYLAMLRLGSSKAGKIAKESQLNRTATYDSLKRLLDKGLISYVIEANIKWFKAVNPERLLEILKEKEEETKKVLPNLIGIYKAPKETHNVTLYYGYKGVKSVFQDIIREGKPNCVLDAEGQFTEKMPYYAPHFSKQVEEKKIPIRHIVRRGVDIHPTKTTEVRFISRELHSTAVTNIYGDRIAIIVWTDPPEAVIIKNKAAADAYRIYFEMIWKTAKE
jgi:sugar-specific transcriptional regulator TrmB